MKIKDGFILRKVADNFVIIAVGEATKTFNGMIRLNETGALLFNALQKGCDEQGLVQALLDEYAIEKDVAERDVQEFLQGLKEANLLA